MKPKILIVEDDNEMNNLLKRILQSENYEILQAYSGTEAVHCLKGYNPNIILLDLMLPGMSGDKFLEQLRNEQYTLPVLVISAKKSVADKVSLLKSGADDYITKPFEPDEILARVQAALRRSGLNPIELCSKELSYKNIDLNHDLRKVAVLKKELSLTVREYEILYLLIQNPEKVYSRENLYELVWQDGYYGADHTVNVHISNLRKKIKEFDPTEEYIQSVYGIGFRLAKS